MNQINISHPAHPFNPAMINHYKNHTHHIGITDIDGFIDSHPFISCFSSVSFVFIILTLILFLNQLSNRKSNKRLRELEKEEIESAKKIIENENIKDYIKK